MNSKDSKMRIQDALDREIEDIRRVGIDAIKELIHRLRKKSFSVFCPQILKEGCH